MSKAHGPAPTTKLFKHFVDKGQNVHLISQPQFLLTNFLSQFFLLFWFIEVNGPEKWSVWEKSKLEKYFHLLVLLPCRKSVDLCDHPDSEPYFIEAPFLSGTQNKCIQCPFLKKSFCLNLCSWQIRTLKQRQTVTKIRYNA